MVFSPDGSRAYLVSYAGRVTAIDVANDAVSATYDVAPQAFDLVLTPDGTRAYVVHVNDEYGTAGIVTALDMATGATTTIAVGDRPYTPIVSPDGRRVYVTNYFSGTVSVIDTADDTVVATVRGYAEARLTPDGRFVYARSTVDERAGITFISTTDDLVTFIPVSAGRGGPRRRAAQPRRAELLRHLERGGRQRADRGLPRRGPAGARRRRAHRLTHPGCPGTSPGPRTVRAAWNA